MILLGLLAAALVLTGLVLLSERKDLGAYLLLMGIMVGAGEWKWVRDH